MRRRGLLSLGIAACCLGSPLRALALGPADDHGDKGVVDLGEVVATGRKLEGIEAGETVHAIGRRVASIGDRDCGDRPHA
jgi:hypothetical protein